jgi:hypothetical protein
MGIRVRHDPQFAGAAELAVQSGMGVRADKDREFSQRDRQLDIQDAQIAAQLAANHARLSADAQAQESAQRHQAEMANRSQSQYMERMAFQDELTKGRIQFEYTEQQKREMEKSAQGIAWVQSQVASGSWTPDQGQQAIAQLEAKMLGIQPVPAYDDTPTGQDIFGKGLVVDNVTGRRFYMQPTGKMEPLDDDFQIGFKDFSALYQSISKTMESMDDEGNVISADPIKVTQAVMGIISGYNMLRSAGAKGLEDNGDGAQIPTGYMQSMGIPQDAGYVPEPGTSVPQAAPQAAQQPAPAEKNDPIAVLSDPSVPPAQKLDVLQANPRLQTPETVIENVAALIDEIADPKDSREARREAVKAEIQRLFPEVYAVMFANQRTRIERTPLNPLNKVTVPSTGKPSDFRLRSF